MTTNHHVPAYPRTIPKSTIREALDLLGININHTSRIEIEHGTITTHGYALDNNDQPTPHTETITTIIITKATP